MELQCSVCFTKTQYCVPVVTLQITPIVGVALFALAVYLGTR
jgi:hypothetical protein